MASFFKFLIMSTITVMYTITNNMVICNDCEAAIRSHPLVFSDDKAIDEFLDTIFLIITTGARILIRDKINNIILLLFIVSIILISKTGIIFCHVIRIRKDIFLNLNEWISFMYQECRGHTPIFKINVWLFT